MTSIRSSLLILIATLALTGCEEGPPYGNTPATAYRIDGTCTQQRPWCNDEFDECMDRGAQACNTCYQIGGLGCASYCDYTEDCQAAHCGRNEGCLTWSHTAILGEQDPAILETCQMAVAHQVACGQQAHPAGACELFAATERAEVAAYYECTANAVCGEEAACTVAPDEDLAIRVCDALAACELSSESCDNGYFVSWFGWLRHDVKDAVRDCTELAECGERRSCIQAWLSSLLPQ